jgi:protein phosphatase
MCTTIVAAHLKKKSLTLCSLGDSRAYLLRDKTLNQLTEDHSTLWPLYKSGNITKEELRNHPRNHILTHAIGGEARLDKREIYSCKENLKKGDIVLLCSDGLSDMLSDEEIAEALKKQIPLEEKAETLIQNANKKGGKDNITALLLTVS